MSVFEFEGHTLDLIQGRLRNSAGDVALRPKSLALLTYFVRNPGRVIGKDELMGAVWPHTFVSDDSLSQCLKDIRCTLGPEAGGLIRTLPRRGYVLDEERVRAVGDRVRAEAPPVQGAVHSQEGKPSIAVLPFDTAGPDQAWFSEGIAEDITTALARSRRLRVISKNYSFAFKSRGIHGDQIAQELQVRYLLEGSVRLLGQRVRVTTRLLEGRTGELLWAERFDRELADIFAVQDEITEAIVAHLEIELAPDEKRAIQQARTDSIEAYHYELRGRQLALALTKPNLLLARRMFAKAVELDPRYARAFAGMVTSDCFLRDLHGQDIDGKALLALAETALHLDVTLAEVHAARGFALFCCGRLEEAEQAYGKALSIDPNSYDANFFSAETMARFTGDRERLISTFGLAARLRVDDYRSPLLVASNLGKDDPERARWARTCLERASHAADIHPESAAPFHRGALALAYLGEIEQAKSWLARALAIDPDDFVTQYNAACMHAVLGETDIALVHLENAVRGLPPNTIDRIRQDGDLDTIRDHPRFSLILGAREA